MAGIEDAFAAATGSKLVDESQPQTEQQVDNQEAQPEQQPEQIVENNEQSSLNNENNISHDFKGKLSYSWPKKSSQYELNFGDESYDPLFKYKYGLTYQDNIFIDSIDIKREKHDKEDFMSKYNIDKDAINELLEEVLEMNKKHASLI